MKYEKQTRVDSKKKNKKKLNIKEYIRDFFLFVNKKLLKTISILFIISIVLIFAAVILVTPIVSQDECVGTCRDGIKLFSEYGSTMDELFVTGFAGIVPYMNISILGFIGGIFGEALNLAYAIKGYGYVLGILATIVPLVLNTVVICAVTSIGIYICNCITIRYRLFNAKGTNWLGFRIKVYEILNNKDKAEILKQKKEEKVKVLEKKREKINYLQVLNTAIVVSIIQFISILIQHIVL